jgi:hypothetical protein
MEEELPEHEVVIDENPKTDFPLSEHYEDLTNQGG